MRRKYRLILVILIGFITSLIMYFSFDNDKISIFFFGDSSLNTPELVELLKNHYRHRLNRINNKYVLNNITTSELYTLIIKNVKNEQGTYIQQEINQSKIVIISVGIDELQNGNNVNIYLYNIDMILKLLRGINKEKIYLLSLQSDNPKIIDINHWLENIATRYDVTFIQVSNGLPDNIRDREIFQKIIDNN